MITTSITSRKRSWNEMGTCPMSLMWWRMQKTYWIQTARMTMTVKVKRPIPTPKPKMNTHPTHTCLWVGWGLRPLIVPIGVDVFFLVGVVSTPWRIDVFFRCIVVFFMHFLERWCVCGRCFFVLSNIVNYIEKKIYIHLQIATPKTPAQSW